MRKFVIYYFLFLVALLSFIVSGYVDSQDGFQYLSVARNIYYTHEPTAPVYEFTGGVGVGKNIHLSTHVGKDGKTYSATGLGFSLALLPAVAISDFVYRIYNLQPAVHFPLENDWLIMLTASATNIFFAAGIGVVLYVYLRELKVGHKTAILVSLLGLLSTNLLVASKYIYAHTMFTFFLFAAFLLLKMHSRNQRKVLLVLSGAFWGIAMMTYNASFIITAVPFFTYFILLNFKRLNKVIWVILGILPFYLINNWYTNLTAYPTIEFVSGVFKNAISTPVGVIYEGLYGQLLSPGRSYFIYSPILLLPILFWFKIKRNIFPEAITFWLIFGLYVVAASLSWSPHPLGFAEPLWHGEYSWGPRYLISTIPFGLLLVGYIIPKIKLVSRIIVVVPLLLVGLYVELLGITMHYQIKFQDLEPYFIVNNIQFTSPTYSNLLPRFSPLISMSKKLIKMVKIFPKTIDNGKYNVRFIDGIDFPFNVGPERWRAIDKKGYIVFDGNTGTAISEMSFDLINHPVGDTKEDSSVTFFLNGVSVSEEILKIGERRKVTIDMQNINLKEKDNLLLVQVDQKDYKSFFDKKQFTAIIDMFINGEAVNKESIDVPYVSVFGNTPTGLRYINWGKESNPWMTWNIHTQVVERTPYFWWLYPIYYWDIPSTPYAILFIINLSGLLYFGRKVLFSLSNPKRTTAEFLEHGK